MQDFRAWGSSMGIPALGFVNLTRRLRMKRHQHTTLALLALPLLVLSLAARSDSTPQDKRGKSKLAPSGAFFEPPIADGSRPLATGRGPDGKPFELGLEDYKRFLVARADRAFLDEFVFSHLIARECKRLGLARTAAPMARANALRHFRLGKMRDPDGSRQRAMENSELLRMRVDAIARKTRVLEARDLRLAFDQAYGLGGVRVEVRQILISRVATERRLRDSGEAAPSEAQIDADAKERCTQIREALRSPSIAFHQVVRQSDDPATKSLLADPRASKERAGRIEGYDYQRYGKEFAQAVRALEVGVLSEPVRTTHGYHIIEVLSRKTTAFEDVEAMLRKKLMAAPASPRETQALRRRLGAEYGVEVRGRAK